MDNEPSSLCTMSSFILQNNGFQVESFRKRYSQLLRIQSHHFFPIRNITSCIDTHSVNIKYKNHAFITLSDYIKDIELLPSQIKSIIWQITKLMVECEQLKINHFQLSTKSIVIAQSQYFNMKNKGQNLAQNPYIWVRDFSFGKQFSTVNQGKKLQYFEFMHPSLSVNNDAFNFSNQFYDSQYDIWSFGIVIYYLIYKKSPFRKQGREVFSKTILRRFVTNRQDYQIPFPNKKYASINQIISKCLNSQFKEWRQIKKWIINQEEIYNDIDFQLTPFHRICQNHMLIMYLFSSIYQMIIKQTQLSVHPFWNMKIENQNEPFVFLTLQYILILITNIHRRFLSLYHSHFIILQNSNRLDMIQQLNTITGSIHNQIQNIDTNWLITKANGKRIIPLTLQITKLCQVNFAAIILKTGINRKRANIQNQSSPPRQSLVILRSGFQNLEQRRMSGWKSLQILFDFCNEMISIFNRTKNHMKLVYEFVYISKILSSIAVNDFKYPLH